MESRKVTLVLDVEPHAKKEIEVERSLRKLIQTGNIPYKEGDLTKNEVKKIPVWVVTHGYTCDDEVSSMTYVFHQRADAYNKAYAIVADERENYGIDPNLKNRDIYPSWSEHTAGEQSLEVENLYVQPNYLKENLSEGLGEGALVEDDYYADEDYDGDEYEDDDIGF